MLLEIENLVKEYNKGFHANDGISLSVEQGEVFGLLGPNGAGKTTLVNQIIGLIVPTSGEIRISGVNVITKPEYARQICSYQSQTQVPISGLTAFHAIELVGLIRGGKKDKVHKRTKELIENLDIGEWSNKVGANLSEGVRRIVAFCMAAVEPGKIVILDEPTNDIDPVRRRPLVIPAFLLVATAGVLLGYFIALGAPKPEIAQVSTQVIVFFIMLFSPILYPVSQLPAWLAAIHKVLPIQYMADLTRGTLTNIPVNLGLAFAVVGAWCIFGLIVTFFLVKRRK